MKRSQILTIVKHITRGIAVLSTFVFVGVGIEVFAQWYSNVPILQFECYTKAEWILQYAYAFFVLGVGLHYAVPEKDDEG